MNNQVQITEEDIFYYVHHPATLSVEKTNYIKANQDKFSPMIDFYKSFKNPISTEEAEQLKCKIEERFSSKSNTIQLLPTWNNDLKEISGLRLAAASTTLEKKVNSTSFADTEHKYLVRIIENQDKRHLFFIPTSPLQENEVVDLLLHPSESRYLIDNPMEPIEVDTYGEILSIKIQIKKKHSR
jgi:hypothetical protein